MSQFPSFIEYSSKKSKLLCKSISLATCFVLKKSKSVYFYDVDENKYVDFSLNNGDILEEHSPPRLTHFMKNALSYGFSSVEIPNSLFFKSLQEWRAFCHLPNIHFYQNPVFAMLDCLQFLSKKEIVVGYNNNYVKKMLHRVSNFVEMRDVSKHDLPVDIIFFEKFCDMYKPWTPPKLSAAIKIELHSRFLGRYVDEKCKSIFNEDCIHLIHSTPFAGKPLTVLASKQKFSFQNFPSFDEAILFTEGLKYLKKSLSKVFPKFLHPHFESYNGFAICNKKLDSKFFLKYGIYIQNNVLFFSPQHSKHDMRRLKKALNAFFTETSNDIPDQKPSLNI